MKLHNEMKWLQKYHSFGLTLAKAINKKSLFFLLLLFSASQSFAQDDVDYSIHANIIYHFTKYVDWPASKKTGDFVIGVIGESPLYDELKKTVADKKVGDQLIVVKKFSSSSVSFNCQILFLSDAASSNIKKIATSTDESPVLLVTENPGLAQKGACINFIIVNDKLRLEINKENIEKRGLNIASELLKLGTAVK